MPVTDELIAEIKRRGTVVNHFVGHLAYGDAVSFDTVNKWRALCDLGVPGAIYAGVMDEPHRRVARPLSQHLARPDELIVFHYSVWSDAAAYVAALPSARLLLVYHNVTPARWFAGVHAQAEEDTRLGRARLPELAPLTPYAVADSEYNRRELDDAGFGESGVVPLMIDFGHLTAPGTKQVRERLTDGYVNVLSVGRVAPNKCHEDTIKLFYHYKRAIQPRSRLILVGAPTVGGYRLWLERLVRRLGLEPHVLFAGHVTDEDKAAYYQLARAYVTMSEHEGFCAPLLESMHAGVPVLAFDSTAVPFTAGDAAVLMKQKDPAVGAELLRHLVDETPLRARMVAKGRERVREFETDHVRDRMVAAVARALGIAR